MIAVVSYFPSNGGLYAVKTFVFYVLFSFLYWAWHVGKISLFRACDLLPLLRRVRCFGGKAAYAPPSEFLFIRPAKGGKAQCFCLARRKLILQGRLGFFGPAPL